MGWMSLSRACLMQLIRKYVLPLLARPSTSSSYDSYKLRDNWGLYPGYIDCRFSRGCGIGDSICFLSSSWVLRAIQWILCKYCSTTILCTLHLPDIFSAEITSSWSNYSIELRCSFSRSYFSSCQYQPCIQSGRWDAGFSIFQLLLLSCYTILITGILAVPDPIISHNPIVSLTVWAYLFEFIVFFLSIILILLIQFHNLRKFQNLLNFFNFLFFFAIIARISLQHHSTVSQKVHQFEILNLIRKGQARQYFRINNNNNNTKIPTKLGPKMQKKSNAKQAQPPTKLNLRKQEDVNQLVTCDTTHVEQLILDKAVKDTDVPLILKSDWTHVKTLIFKSSLQSISPKSFRQIMGINWISLEELVFDQCRFSDEIYSILFSRQLPKLKFLKIQSDQGCSGFSSIGLRPIVERKYENLTCLKLKQTEIGSKGIKLLLKVQMASLKRLILEFCQMGNQGTKHLAKGYWPKLQVLTINDNQIHLDGHLQLSTSFSKLLRKFRSGTCCEQSYNIVLQPITYMNLISLESKNTIMLMRYMSYVNEDLIQHVNSVLNECYMSHHQDQQPESQHEYEIELG